MKLGPGFDLDGPTEIVVFSMKCSFTRKVVLSLQECNSGGGLNLSTSQKESDYS